jgi:glycosyltransferase involved in cell wall biosynthesis
MRIAIDARELVGQPTGVGRYLREIVSAWATLPGAARHEFVLCAASDLPPIAGLTSTSISAPGHGTAWEQLVLPRLVRHSRADVLFAPAYTGPVWGSLPMVLSVHDVSFAAHPEWFGWREGLRRRMVTKLAARRAVKVLTISDFSRAEIVRHLGVAPAKVDVIYPGVTVHRRPGGRPAPERHDPTVLYVGSIFNRRHIPELIAGFAALANRYPGVRLEIVGDNRSHPRLPIEELAQGSAVGHRIRVRSYVSESELADLYAEASAFAFLSDYEGFGLTPLDALALDVPIVVLDTAVAREVYGAAAEYVAEPRPALIADALARVLFDAPERARLLEAGRVTIERYSWQECAQRTLQILAASAGHR